MKSGIIIGGVAAVVVAASGVSNVMMIQRMNAVEGKVNSFTPHQINISPEMQAEIVKKLAADNKTGITEISVKLSDIEKAQKSETVVLSGKLSDIKNAQKSESEALIAKLSGIEKVQKQDNEAMSGKLADIEKARSKDITSLRSRLEKLEAVQKQSEIKAVKSFELAKQLKAQGKIVEAKTYALNAINHQKDNPEYLKFYADTVINDANATGIELDQVAAVLDASLFNVSAEDINGIIAIRNSVAQKKNKISVATAAPAVDLNKEIASVISGKYAMAKIVDNDNINMDLLKQRIEKINALLGEELSQAQRNQLTAELQDASNIFSAQLTFESVENALAKAEVYSKASELSKKQILIARNQLSTANTLLAQIWTTKLPANIVKKGESIQKEIDVIDKDLNKLASQDAMKKHDELKEKLEKIEKTIDQKSAKDYAKEVADKRAKKEYNKKGTLTVYLEDIQKYASELRTLKIFDKEGQEKAVKTFEYTQTLALKVSAKRYQAYQMWAIEKIEAARESRMSVSAFKPYRNIRAIADFENYLKDIDRSLLTYDVGTCYDKVYNLIFAEQVPDNQKARLQYEKATFDKLGKLEDF